MMPDLGNQLHGTLYTFIVLGKIMYSNIFYDIVFYCIVVLLIFYCFKKRISVSPKPGMVYISITQFPYDGSPNNKVVIKTYTPVKCFTSL